MIYSDCNSEKTLVGSALDSNFVLAIETAVGHFELVVAAKLVHSSTSLPFRETFPARDFQVAALAVAADCTVFGWEIVVASDCLLLS